MKSITLTATEWLNCESETLAHILDNKDMYNDVIASYKDSDTLFDAMHPMHTPVYPLDKITMSDWDLRMRLVTKLVPNVVVIYVEDIGLCITPNTFNENANDALELACYILNDGGHEFDITCADSISSDADAILEQCRANGKFCSVYNIVDFVEGV